MPPDPRRVELSDRIRLQHMLDAATQAVGFVSGKVRADLDADPMLARAVMHAIQEIGEAASRITQATRDRVPGVPWTQIVGMRHRMVHVYWGVNLNLVWEVVARDLQALIASLNDSVKDWPLEPRP